MHEYSVGIPVRNEEGTLETCVQSVLEQSLLPRHIYICLNGSNTATRVLAEQLSIKHKSINLLESSPGKAHAWNRITEKSETNTILFTDGDAYLSPDAGAQMILALENNSECCVSGGNLFYMKPVHDFLLKPLFKNKCNKIYAVKNLSGANYMIKRDELLELAHRHSVDLMPTDIIHDDALVGAIARVEKKFIAANTYAKVYPVSTIGDYVNLMMRLRKGYIQLEEKYPELFYNKHTAGVDGSRTHNIASYSIVQSITQPCVDFVLKLGSKKTETCWKESKSTKPTCIRYETTN